MERVAGVVLVRPVPAEDDLHRFRGFLGELVVGEEQDVADRALHVPEHLREEVEVVDRDIDLVMVCPEAGGEGTGLAGLVDRGVEADGEGIDLVRVAGHGGGHDAGVDAAAEVGSDRDVAAHGELDRVEEQVLEFLVVIGVRPVGSLVEADVPVALDAQFVFPDVEPELVGGGEDEDVLEEGLRLRDIAQAEVGVDGGGVATPLDGLVLEDGLHLRAEEEATVLVIVIERLLARAVAGHEERTRSASRRARRRTSRSACRGRPRRIPRRRGR